MKIRITKHLKQIKVKEEKVIDPNWKEKLQELCKFCEDYKAGRIKEKNKRTKLRKKVKVEYPKELPDIIMDTFRSIYGD